MPTVTFNVSFNEDLADFLESEVSQGAFSTASEAVRHAVREWRDRRIAEDVAALAAAHKGAPNRDVTDAELAEILDAQRAVRAERLAARAKSESKPRRLIERKPVSARAEAKATAV